MPKYLVEDDITGKKFEFEGEREPTQTEIEDYVFGTISRPSSIVEKLGEFRRAITEPVPEEMRPMFGQMAEEARANVPALWTLRQLDRPIAGIRNITAGKSFIEGFKQPETTNWDHFVEPALDFWELKDPLPRVIGKGVMNLALDVLTYRLTYSTLPKAVKAEYTGIQGKAVDRLKTNLVREFEVAGIPKEQARSAADLVVAQQWNKSNVLQRSPIGINAVSSKLEARQGVFGQQLKQAMNTAKEDAARQGFTEEWFRKAATTAPTLEGAKITQPLKLEYKGVPPLVAKTLPSEVIPPPSQDEVLKTLSRFPQKVVDQKSLEEKGNAIAKELGIVRPITYNYKVVDDKYHTAQISMPVDETKPLHVLLRVPKEKLSRVEVMELLESERSIQGSRGARLIAELQATQGKITKSLVHEFSHALTPGESHSSIFWDEVKYHEASSLIKKELRKVQALPTGEGKPLIQSPHFAAYPHAEGTQVVNQIGEEIEVFESQAAAQRWITSAEQEFTKTPKPVFREKTKPENRATVDSLIDNPDLADTVLANPSAYSPEVVNFAHEIKREYSKLPPVTSEKLVADPSKAEEVLQRPMSQSPEVIEQAKEIKGEPTPEIAKTSERVTGDFDPDATYNVQYGSLGGSKDTLMSGSDLNTLNNELKAGRNPTVNGNVLTRIIDAFPIKGERGSLDLTALEQIYLDLQGEGEKVSATFKHTAKKFGVPFFVGQKYPAFKPVYMSIQNAIDTKGELFFEGASILNPRQLLKLPDASQARLTNVIKIGNSAPIQKWFSDRELTEQFNLSPEEILAYKAIKDTYAYATQLEIQSRKQLMEYDKLTPEQREAANAQIEKQVKKLDGYVSQTRLTGDWAVYLPPSKEGETARFFNLYLSKSEAVRAAELLGPGAKMYLRRGLDREIYRHLTLADLESLIESSDVNAASPDIEALRKELRKKTFSAHWIHRQDVPGYEWNFPNLLDSAIDYLEGAANKLTRITGRHNAETAFRENVGKMTPEIRSYARDFLDAYSNSGAIGFRDLNRLIYSWKLAFKLSWLGQNLTQPLATTYPAMSQYYQGLDTEKAFISSYDQARRYLMYRMKGEPHGLSSDLIRMLNKAHKQGVLGDQMTRFQLGVRTLKEENIEKALGLFGRVGEGVNRTHAAISGYRIATDKLGLTDEHAILGFMKEFIYKTQFAFGKQNLPLWITGAGNMRNLLRTAYTFRHYTVNYLQLMNSMMPWRGAKWGQTLRAVGILLAQAGIKGLPFAGLIALAYKKMFGRVMEDDTRMALKEAGLPDKAIDLSLHGGYAALGIDASNLVGVGDAIPTYGSTAEMVGGAAVGMFNQLRRGVWHASRGEYGRAMENVSPDAIKNVIKGWRYTQEGLRKASGELISTPSKLDSALAGIGFTPLSVAKAYDREEVMSTMLETSRRRSGEFHERMAKAVFARDREAMKKVYKEVREHNAKSPREARVQLNNTAVYNRVREMKGRQTQVPVKMRQKFRELEKVYGGRR